jgi:hypothetical protein
MHRISKYIHSMNTGSPIGRITRKYESTEDKEGREFYEIQF